jgi:peptidoglycan/LPS O-acetylase OafA/YrhL
MNNSVKDFHSNNFDFLRLLFAVFVLITHSYSLLGLAENDWMVQITNQTSFSQIGVSGFFAISGYLVYLSLIRSKNLFDYYSKRFLRLFPGLIVMLSITVLIIAPLLVVNPAKLYFKDPSTWSYYFKNILLQTQYNINGLFVNLPYPKSVNGSLWTIPYEFSCYVILGCLFFLKNNTLLLRILLVVAMILFFIIKFCFLKTFSIWTPGFKINTELLIEYGGYFLMGSFF